MKFPDIIIKFQSPVIIRIHRKIDFLKLVEKELEDGRSLNALRIYKIYTGLRLKEAKDDFDELNYLMIRDTEKGRKKIIRGVKTIIIKRKKL